MLTGTDEHGMKVQKAAQEAGMDVKVFCDRHMEQFKRLAQRADVDYDYFIRTTDPDHKSAVEHFWRELKHRGYIYESKHDGWYSVSDETFFPQSAVHLVLDPSTGRKHMASMETGKEVEWTSETNYHFRLSHFKDRLLEHYKAHPEFIVPKSRMKYVINEVQNGLGDLSISRPVSRLTWGVRVPDDDSQTVYVWLDALVNYLTRAGYPFTPGLEKDTIWPPNCQVIGKDIVKFHCIYWPAFLMALDLPLPTQFLAHAHWTMNHEKMSKSTGNVVNPFFAFDRFGVDSMRFYMVNNGGMVDDASYENAFIINAYKRGLQGGLGNLVSRIIRGQKWNVSESVRRAEKEESAISKPESPHESLEDVIFQQCLKDGRENAAEHMAELNPQEALQAVMNLVHRVSRLIPRN